MTFVNRVILTGRVIAPPRRHYRPDGSPVIEFPLELNESGEGAGPALSHNGRKPGRRNRIDIVAIGELAEIEVDLLQSGRHVVVTGKLNQRCWQTPEGRNRTQTEVIATSLQAMKEKTPTPTSTLRLAEREVDGCSALTPGSGKPGLESRDWQAPSGSGKEGE